MKTPKIPAEVVQAADLMSAGWLGAGLLFATLIQLDPTPPPAMSIAVTLLAVGVLFQLSVQARAVIRRRAAAKEVN